MSEERGFALYEVEPPEAQDYIASLQVENESLKGEMAGIADALEEVMPVEFAATIGEIRAYLAALQKNKVGMKKTEIEFDGMLQTLGQEYGFDQTGRIELKFDLTAEQVKAVKIKLSGNSKPLHIHIQEAAS